MKVRERKLDIVKKVRETVIPREGVERFDASGNTVPDRLDK